MIYTLTMNPSLDYIMETEQLNIGEINRIFSSYILAGGKGINVSTVLTNLGVENRTILPVGGFTGDKLLTLLDERNIKYDAVFMKSGDTRINVKVLGKEETQLNTQGTELTGEEIERLFLILDQIKDGDCLILSGSVPKGLGEDFYAQIMERLQHKNIQVIVDACGENLKNALAYKPFLIKPNEEELKDLFGENSLEDMAKMAQEMGARNVLVSCGEKGAMLLTECGDMMWQVSPDGDAVNTVGAGDSMVAGFVKGISEDKKHYVNALKMAVAAGSASAFSRELATKQEIDALYKKLCYNER